MRIARDEFERRDVLRGNDPPTCDLAAMHKFCEEGVAEFYGVGSENYFAVEHSQRQVGAEQKETNTEERQQDRGAGSRCASASCEIPDAEKVGNGQDVAGRNEHQPVAQGRLIGAWELRRVEPARIW